MNRKPTVLFVGPLPPPFAGPEISAKMFLDSAVKDHFEIIPFNTNFRKSNSDKGKIDASLFLAFFQLNFTLITKLLKYRPNIVYYYVTATILGWLGKDIWVILFSKLLGAKVVVHMRAGHFRQAYDSSSTLPKFIIKRVLNITDYNLAQSPSLASQYDNIVKNKAKVGFIYNMIKIPDHAIPELHDLGQQPLVFFMGHLSQAKGYCDILKIIPDVVKEFPNVKFSFAGTMIKEERNVLFNAVNKEPIQFSDPEQVFQEYIKGKYESNFQYLGKLDDNEKIKWMRKCDMFILPSYSEGFSMSVLEAIAYAIPIVTTPVGALKDVIEHGENGLLVQPGNLDQLKNAILSLLNNESKRKRIIKNNKEMRMRFSVDVLEKEYITLFKRLI